MCGGLEENRGDHNGKHGLQRYETRVDKAPASGVCVWRVLAWWHISLFGSRRWKSIFRVYGTISLGLRFQDVLACGGFLASIEWNRYSRMDLMMFE